MYSELCINPIIVCLKTLTCLKTEALQIKTKKLLEDKMMSIRPLTKEDMLENARLGAICYNFPFDEEKTREKIKKEAEPHKGYWGYFSDDNVLHAALAAFEYDVHYQGKPSKMGGIGNVVSLPEARRGGKVRELFTVCLEDLYQKGIPFSTLYPFSHPYYEKFGYALASKTLSYKVPIDSLPKVKQNTWARQITAKEDLSDLVRVYNQFNAAYNLSSLRNASQWRKRLPQNPYTENTYAYLLGEDEEDANAFVLFSSHMEGNEKNMQVHTLAFSSPKGLYSCFNFFYRFLGQFEHGIFSLPRNIPLAELIPEPYRLSARYGSQPMARVVDTQGVLNLLAANQNHIAFTIEITDPFFTPSQGTWEVQAGKAEKNVLAKADCSLSIQTFSQLAVGAITFDQALYKADVVLNDNGNALKSFFSVRPFLLTDSF